MHACSSQISKPSSIKRQGATLCMNQKKGLQAGPLACTIQVLSLFALGLWKFPTWLLDGIAKISQFQIDCLNACLLWPKPRSIEWQGVTFCMNHKKGFRLGPLHSPCKSWLNFVPGSVEIPSLVSHGISKINKFQTDCLNQSQALQNDRVQPPAWTIIIGPDNPTC